MRLKVTLHYLGLLTMGVGAAMLLPLLWSLLSGGDGAPALATSMVVTLGAGLLLWQSMPLRAAETRMSHREVIALVVGAWVSASVFGALPFFLSGALPTYLDSLFEAVSGYTTTGASVFTTVEGVPQGIILWRALTQWLGGMGIVMLFVALFPLLGIGAAQLAEAETPGQQGERLTARMQDTAKALWLIYVGLTGAEVLLLLVSGVPAFDSITISLTTIPTGGFAPTDLSIATYNNLFAEIIVIIFMVLSGVNFGLYYLLLWKRRVGSFFRDSEFRLYILLLVGAMLVINWDLVSHLDLSLGQAMRISSFQAVSIMTTTGFATADFNVWPDFSRAVLLMLMVAGACAGSTGGGIKVVRLLMLAKYIYRRVLQAFNPGAVVPLKINGSIVPETVVSRIVSLSIFYFATIVVGFLIMSGLGMDLISALSSVIACLGNIGPGLGTVGPASNFFAVPALGKGVLIFCMLAGRLEIFTLLIVLSPAFWRWR